MTSEALTKLEKELDKTIYRYVERLVYLLHLPIEIKNTSINAHGNEYDDVQVWANIKVKDRWNQEFEMPTIIIVGCESGKLFEPLTDGYKKLDQAAGIDPIKYQGKEVELAKIRILRAIYTTVDDVTNWRMRLINAKRVWAQVNTNAGGTMLYSTDTYN